MLARVLLRPSSGTAVWHLSTWHVGCRLGWHYCQRPLLLHVPKAQVGRSVRSTGLLSGRGHLQFTEHTSRDFWGDPPSRRALGTPGMCPFPALNYLLSELFAMLVNPSVLYNTPYSLAMHVILPVRSRYQ